MGVAPPPGTPAPDGQFVWDGQCWQAAAPDVLSPDGVHRWDGAAWVPTAALSEGVTKPGRRGIWDVAAIFAVVLLAVAIALVVRGSSGNGSPAALSATASPPPAPAITVPAGSTAQSASVPNVEAVVAATLSSLGYTGSPGATTAAWDTTHTLYVTVGIPKDNADGHTQQAFFFVRGAYIGKDLATTSAGIMVGPTGVDDIQLIYSVYVPYAGLCCPTGTKSVRFHWDDAARRLSTLDPVPPASDRGGSPPAATPMPSAPVLSVPEFGFQMTLSPAIVDATYVIDHSQDGTRVAYNGRSYTVFGIVDLSTRSLESNPQCADAGPEGTWWPASLEVLSADPRQIFIADGPSKSRQLGSYWLGDQAPQWYPECVQAQNAPQIFGDAFDTIVPLP